MKQVCRLLLRQTLLSDRGSNLNQQGLWRWSPSERSVSPAVE